MFGPEDRLRLLLSLARRFPDSWITINVSWDNENGRAGINTSDDGILVYLNSAQEEVADLTEAEAIMRKIFADEIVSVTGYDREQFQFCRLVPADAIAGGIPKPGYNVWNDVISCDHLVVETWSQGMLPPAAEDD